MLAHDNIDAVLTGQPALSLVTLRKHVWSTTADIDEPTFMKSAQFGPRWWLSRRMVSSEEVHDLSAEVIRMLEKEGVASLHQAPSPAHGRSP